MDLRFTAAEHGLGQDDITAVLVAASHNAGVQTPGL